MIRRIIALLLASVAVLFGATVPAEAATTSKAYITGYSFYDNDPPGSAEIAFPGLHKLAGGIGTYADPTTLAVGLVNGKPVLKPGTRVYIPALGRYFIVEDSCAACGRGHNGLKWYDVWVGGQGDTEAEANACMDKITAVHTVIVNPASNYRVYALGDIAHKHGCIALRGETPRTA